MSKFYKSLTTSCTLLSFPNLYKSPYLHNFETSYYHLPLAAHIGNFQSLTRISYILYSTYDNTLYYIRYILYYMLYIYYLLNSIYYISKFYKSLTTSYTPLIFPNLYKSPTTTCTTLKLPITCNFVYH